MFGVRDHAHWIQIEILCRMPLLRPLDLKSKPKIIKTRYFHSPCNICVVLQQKTCLLLQQKTCLPLPLQQKSCLLLQHKTSFLLQQKKCLLLQQKRCLLLQEEMSSEQKTSLPKSQGSPVPRSAPRQNILEILTEGRAGHSKIKSTHPRATTFPSFPFLRWIFSGNPD